MSSSASMLGKADAQARAKTRFERNWRTWAQELLAGMPCPELSVDLKPPRERDMETREGLERARAWVEEWRSCSGQLAEDVEWAERSWPRVGNQRVPVRVRMEGAPAIARWSGTQRRWECAERRVAQVRERLDGWKASARCAAFAQLDEAEQAIRVGFAVKESVAQWCALDECTWQMTLEVLDWLFSHGGSWPYVRQLPIRGIDTKWVERNAAGLRALFQALTGEPPSFAAPRKLFRCKACDPMLRLSGCDEFALSAQQLSQLELRPRKLLVCENLVNVLCAPAIEGVLALHGGGYAVTELAQVGWLEHTPVVYWGDLDSNGFAILDALRSFAPHARSVMMDAETLRRYMDLCVEEPKPATARATRLTAAEAEALALLAAGSAELGVRNLRLEQERVEWAWACEQLVAALG